MKDTLKEELLVNELRDFVSGLTSEELVYLLYQNHLGYDPRLKDVIVPGSPPQHF